MNWKTKLNLTVMVWCGSQLFEFVDVKRTPDKKEVIGVLFTNEDPALFFEFEEDNTPD